MKSSAFDTRNVRTCVFTFKSKVKISHKLKIERLSNPGFQSSLRSHASATRPHGMHPESCLIPWFSLSFLRFTSNAAWLQLSCQNQPSSVLLCSSCIRSLSIYILYSYHYLCCTSAQHGPVAFFGRLSPTFAVSTILYRILSFKTPPLWQNGSNVFQVGVSFKPFRLHVTLKSQSRLRHSC